MNVYWLYTTFNGWFHPAI